MTVLNGERYLVSMLGNDAAWVRNLRAADGSAVLRHGRVIYRSFPIYHHSRGCEYADSS